MNLANDIINNKTNFKFEPLQKFLLVLNRLAGIYRRLAKCSRAAIYLP